MCRKAIIGDGRSLTDGHKILSFRTENACVLQIFLFVRET